MPTNSNVIFGKVVLKESGLGIPNLLVIIFDRDPNTQPQDIKKRSSDKRGGDASAVNTTGFGDRLGSVLTSIDGQFSLEYDDQEFRIRNPDEQRPDLFLGVIGPEDGDRILEGPVILFQNVFARQNAGRTESYLIRIPKQHLIDAGIPIPEETVPEVQVEVQKYRTIQETRFNLNRGIADFNREVIDINVAEKITFREKIKRAIAPELDDVAGSGVVLRDGETINEKVIQVANRGVAKANSLLNPDTVGVPVNLYLTIEDRERLQEFFDNAVEGIAEIPESAIRPILFRTNSSENIGTLLVHNNPIAKYCYEKTVDELCAMEDLEINEPDPEDPNEPEEPNDDLDFDIDEIPGLIGRMVVDMQSPETIEQPGNIPQRPNGSTIEDSLDELSLNKGPADVPAYYDFHSLQIAFEHVWKQLFDEEIINNGYRVQQSLRNRTGINLLNNDDIAVADISELLTTADSSPVGEIPEQVASHFEITKEEWNELTNPLQIRLFGLAIQINNVLFTEREPDIFGLLRGARTSIRKLTVQDEKHRQYLIEQGERIIDSVRHDDYYTMHKTLKDLQQRLTGKYEYTVFAADKDSSSVNFGILNTFRQEWMPLNYQVGKLCKTIPLGLKEERKYSLKITKHIKSSEKQTRKSNTSFSTEQSETSRSEAEIISKALNKTNFNLTADGTFNIGLSKASSSTSLGVESIKDAQQSRRDFREAVIKSVQEYKDERSIEIMTEESSEFQSQDSGTISNPNDELAVTYLFYELQRRYRISEQLYRVMPVVLVAQPVPQPDEITEAWVISYDWILHRFLLDESFRPALNYLASKSVGDDFAIRELRRNMRQQRNLVEILKLEMSVAKERADNRYSALERAIRERIEEEKSESTDGFLGDIGDFVFGGGEDPESAKALEMAAKDAHEFAVEKADKVIAALRQEVDSLNKLTMEYNATLRRHLDNEALIKRLLLHIRDNIIYYMQAIWSLEPPDQRFLRLQKVQVPQLELDDSNGDGRIYRVEVDPSEDIFGMFREEGTQKHKARMFGILRQNPEFKALIEVADLDKPLGFKGNYIIFPMKQHNAMTEFMAAPYIDTAFGAMDPDELGNLNLNDFSRFICCLHQQDPELFETLKPLLREWLERLLADPLRNGDEIVIPSGSLYIEALPAAHPLLEDFKLKHRKLDLSRTQAEVRQKELENLRFASRLLSDEREDPNVDKRILVKHDGVNPSINLEDA